MKINATTCAHVRSTHTLMDRYLRIEKNLEQCIPGRHLKHQKVYRRTGGGISSIKTQRKRWPEKINLIPVVRLHLTIQVHLHRCPWRESGNRSSLGKWGSDDTFKWRGGDQSGKEYVCCPALAAICLYRNQYIFQVWIWISTVGPQSSPLFTECLIHRHGMTSNDVSDQRPI